MPALSDYTSGTITLTNGSVNFTGAGTGWQAADFREGDTILGIEDNAGVEYVIASITGNGAGTLTQEWEGATGTYAYRMRYMADGARVTAQARNLIELLGNGNLQALAGLTGPGVPVFNGPHAMEIKPVTDFVNGVAYDVQVDTIADRAAYDGQSEGFAVLVSDTGDGRSALFSKASNTSGDWTDPAYITGPVGPMPDVEATVDTLPPGSSATVTPTPITGGVRLDFELPEASGFYNAGVYDIAEAYSQDDVVRHNGSSFIALQAVPAGTSPSNAFPPTDTAYWQVLAAKGADGAGTVTTISEGDGIDVDLTDPTDPVVSLLPFTGDSGSGGALGGVPAPAAGDGALKKILNASGQWVLPPPEPNLLMNPDFAINQRGFTSGGSAVNARTFDRWLVWSSGHTVTFNSDINRVVTIGAGVLFYQVVRAEQNEGGQHVLNWGGTATAEVRIGSTWTAVTKGTPFSLTANQSIGVRFGPGTLSKPKLEKGSFSTPYVKPNRELSLEACKAYYQVTRAFILFTAAAGDYVYVSVFLGTVMRATPTVTESVLSADVNLSGRTIDELSPFGCRIYGTATNTGSVGMWRQLAFDAEITE